MKIAVKYDDNRKLNIRFPSCLVFNGLVCTVAAGSINKKLKKEGISGCRLSAKQLRRLSRTIMKYRRRHRDWKLVEVSSSDGDSVTIKL